MPVYVLENAGTDKVLNDLAQLAVFPLTIDLGVSQLVDPDTGAMSLIRGTGLVQFAQAPNASTPGSDLLQILINMPVTVGIRAEGDAFSVFPTVGWLLDIVAGCVYYNDYPAPAPDIVDVVYDPGGCNGTGFWCQGQSDRIDLPSHVILFHELAHVLDIINGVFDPNDPEPSAINQENMYRTYCGLPLRSTHDGGCWGRWGRLRRPKWFFITFLEWLRRFFGSS